jgi:hypothetical protein
MLVSTKNETSNMQIDLFGFIKAIRDKAGPEAASAVSRIFDVRQPVHAMP